MEQNTSRYEKLSKWLDYHGEIHQREPILGAGRIASYVHVGDVDFDLLLRGCVDDPTTAWVVRVVLRIVGRREVLFVCRRVERPATDACNQTETQKSKTQLGFQNYSSNTRWTLNEFYEKS